MGEPDIRQIVAVFCFFKFWKQQGVELLVYLGKKEILFRFQKKNFAVEVADFTELYRARLLVSCKVFYKLQQFCFFFPGSMKSPDCNMRRNFIFNHKAVSGFIRNGL